MSETEKPTISQTLKAGIALMPNLATAKAKPVPSAMNESMAVAPAPAPVANVADVIKVAKAATVAKVTIKPGPVVGKTMFLLPVELAAKLAKPVTGQGGWQTMLAMLQGYMADFNGTTYMSLPDSYVTGKLVPLTVKYGGGGYQSMVRHIVCLWLAAKEGI